MGAALGDLAHAGQQFYAGVEEKETRAALIESTAIRAKYANLLDEAETSGQDLDKLKLAMNDDLSRVGEQFATRKGQDTLDMHTSNTNLMFDQQANAIAVRRATSDARLGAAKFLSSTAAMLQSNPLYLGTAEQDAELLGSTFIGVSPQQRAAIVDGLKSDLNMTAALSSARLDPQVTRVMLDSGAWTLTPEQRETALNKAEQEIRAGLAAESYEREEERRRLEQADSEARDKYFKGIIGGTATSREILDDANLLPPTREHLIMLMERRAEEGAGGVKKSNPVTMRNLWLDIHAPETDPRKIYVGDKIFKAVQKGLLNTADADRLNALVANQRDENNRTIGSRLSSLMGVVGRALSADPKFIMQPALVAEIQMDYQDRVFDKVEELRNAKKNPNDVFDPASKVYVGSRAFIQGSIDAVSERARAVGAPAMTKPGETVTKDGKLWRFKGGDPAKKENWEQVESGNVQKIPR